MALLATLAFSGCEEESPVSGSDPYFVSRMWAEWTAADSVEIHVRFGEANGPYRQDTRTVEFSLYSGASKDGPWTKIAYELWRSERLNREFVYTLKMPQSSELTFFYVESRFYMGGSLNAAYNGPLIATMQPLMTPENWQVLPNLTTTVPITATTDEPIWPYQASTLSPDGSLLFIQNDMNRVYDLSNGREVHRRPLTTPQHTGGHSYWFDSGIYINNYGGLTAIDPSTFVEKRRIEGLNSFLRGDSMFVILQYSKWYTYNIRTQRLDSIPPEFSVQHSDFKKASISQSPSGRFYGANDVHASYDEWRLFDTGMNLYRSLSPLNKSGIHYQMYSWLQYGSPLWVDMYWLSDEVVMMNTRWSGEEEYWCYRIPTGSYYQITGRWMPPAFEGGDHTPFLTRRMIVNPVYDRKNNRILFIYELNADTHAVRAFQLPW